MTWISGEEPTVKGYYQCMVANDHSCLPPDWVQECTKFWDGEWERLMPSEKMVAWKHPVMRNGKELMAFQKTKGYKFLDEPKDL